MASVETFRKIRRLSRVHGKTIRSIAKSASKSRNKIREMLLSDGSSSRAPALMILDPNADKAAASVMASAQGLEHLSVQAGFIHRASLRSAVSSVYSGHGTFLQKSPGGEIESPNCPTAGTHSRTKSILLAISKEWSFRKGPKLEAAGCSVSSMQHRHPLTARHGVGSTYMIDRRGHGI